MPQSLEFDSRRPHVLAFGSRLSFGSVGLNAEGLTSAPDRRPAAQIPTILLSVLPHYPSTHAVQIPGSWITDALDDLAAAGALAELRLVTVGYLASVDQVERIAVWYTSRPRETRPLFVLDPTLGDVDTGLYTDVSVVDGVRDTLLPLAHGLVPNLFELSRLTGRAVDELDTPETISQAARSLMTPGTDWIVVTGVHARRRHGHEPPPVIGEVIVTRSETVVHTHPFVPTAAKGLGDVFTARLNAALIDGFDVVEAADSAALTVLTRILSNPRTPL